MRYKTNTCIGEMSKLWQKKKKFMMLCLFCKKNDHDIVFILQMTYLYPK